MRAASGQAAIETIFVVPLCVACAVALVSAGLYVRGELAVRDAAGRAGAAAVRGEDASAAARSALPQGLRRGVRVERDGRELTVSIRTRGGALTPLLPGRQDSTVVVGQAGGRA
jgi:Flp pilus assembly protein TadG